MMIRTSNDFLTSVNETETSNRIVDNTPPAFFLTYIIMPSLFSMTPFWVRRWKNCDVWRLYERDLPNAGNGMFRRWRVPPTPSTREDVKVVI